jgi:signal transduction histidine kinase
LTADPLVTTRLAEQSRLERSRRGRTLPVGDWESIVRARRYARARRLARDLVELSRLDRGGERAERAPADLARMVEAIRVDYPQLEVAGPERLVVSTDSRRLSRILFVLLENAHVHGAPPVSLRYDAVAIVIRDGGDGFAPSLLERATEPFVAADRWRGRGLGLGLAIASRQAALLGAELELANSDGGGAQAVLRFASSDGA